MKNQLFIMNYQTSEENPNYHCGLAKAESQDCMLANTPTLVSGKAWAPRKKQASALEQSIADEYQVTEPTDHGPSFESTNSPKRPEDFKNVG